MRGFRTLVVGVLLAGLVALPGAATGQDEPTAPEGVDWKLTGFPDPDPEGTTSPDEGEVVEEEDSALAPVPFGIAATLRLDGGQASGSGGCNTFGGGYTLDGTSLLFSEINTTLVLCEEDVQQVEDAYLGALPEVRSWLILEGILQLADEAGAPLLTFEVPDISLTSSELAALVATLDSLATEVASLREDLDGVSDETSAVQRLRERIRALETTSERLARELGARPQAPEEPSEPTGGFTGPERVLLEGIPSRISSRCEPLRSGLPSGARAAVTCDPNTTLVSRLDYFIMEGEAAARAFSTTMDDHGVPEATSEDTTCTAGRRSQQVYIGSGWQAEGCYRSDGRAHLRFVDNATECRQLPLGEGRRLRSPALYMAVTGTVTEIARVHEWATGGDDAALTRLSRPIDRPAQPISPSCPT